jgi:RNA polymerase sigma-70 factor (ECF subfamily)
MIKKAGDSPPIPSVNAAPTLTRELPKGPPHVFEPDLRATFRDHGAFVWRTLRRLGVNDADVEDVGQEVFLVVHRKSAEYDGRAGVRPWLYGICARKASDHRRSAYVRRERAVASVPEETVPAEQPATVERRQARALLDTILAQLDPQKREVFVLFELEELSLAEVAAAVGCPLQTAFSRLQTARGLVEAAVLRLQKGGLT